MRDAVGKSGLWGAAQFEERCWAEGTAGEEVPGIGLVKQSVICAARKLDDLTRVSAISFFRASLMNLCGSTLSSTTHGHIIVAVISVVSVVAHPPRGL
jgi:hypothetical protein